jgi:hypothetical protein
VIVNLTGYIPAARYDALPWTHARLEEASSAGGPWTAAETFTLSPVDADPSQPASRSFTTTLATLTAGWYRVVWTDAAMLESATAPVQNVLPFASTDEFAARLGLTLTAAEETRAEQLLKLATGFIQQETAQTISLVTADTLTVRSTYAERYRLPERPVLSVSSVSLTPQGGTPTVIGTDTYYLDGDDLVRASFPIHYQQFFTNWTRGWLGPLFEMTIVYTHGFAVVPEIVKAVCMEMVVRVWINPGAVARETVGNVSTVYDNMRFSPTGLLMTDVERELITSIIRRQSGSLTLR